MLYLQQGIRGQKPCPSGAPQFLNPTASVSNACFQTEDMMIDHDAQPALIYVPNPAELRGPRRASALTRTAGLSADDRRDDDVEH